MLTSLKTSHICFLFCIELCQIVCDPCEIRFMLLRSRSRTLHIYLCRLLHWKLRKNMPLIHTKILYHFNMTLHIAKRIWAMEKKSRRKISVPRSMEKKKNKNSPYPKVKKIKSCRRECEFHPKISHTCTSWSDCMTCFLYWVWFFTLQYMRYKYASSSSPTWAPPKYLIRNREERGDPMPWWGIIHIERCDKVIWGAKFYFNFKNL